EPGLAHAGADEHVDHRVTVAQCENLAEVAIVEQAQCRGSPCLGAQHSSSVSAHRVGMARRTLVAARQGGPTRPGSAQPDAPGAKDTRWAPAVAAPQARLSRSGAGWAGPGRWR